MSSSRTETRRSHKALQILNEYAPLLPQSGWVHLGCGRGETLHLAERKHLLAPGENWGVESSREALSEASSLYPDLARWISSSPTEPPLPSGSARVLLLTKEGSSDDLLRESRRLARQNAIVLISLPEDGEDSVSKSAQIVAAKNRDWQNGQSLPSSPTLQELVHAAPDHHLVPFWGAEYYEPTGYSSSQIRWKEIERDRKESILKIFRDDFQQAAWSEIEEHWKRSLPSNGTYRHRGFSSYLLLRASAK